MAALRERGDNDRLESLEHLIGVDMNQVDPNLKDYEELLHETFGTMRKWPAFDVQCDLFAHGVFKKWRTSKNSNLMILHGSTIYPEQTELSWISPAALRLVSDFEEIFQDDPPVMIRHFCRLTESGAAPPERIPLHMVLSSLIFQIVRSRQGRSLLINEKVYAEVKREIAAVNIIPQDELIERVKKLFPILKKVLKGSGIKKLLVVIDRLDQIQGDRDWFLDPLMDMMKSEEMEQISIKTLVTLRVPFGFDHSSLEYKLGKDRYSHLEFDQEN